MFARGRSARAKYDPLMAACVRDLQSVNLAPHGSWAKGRVCFGALAALLFVPGCSKPQPRAQTSIRDSDVVAQAAWSNLALPGLDTLPPLPPELAPYVDQIAGIEVVARSPGGSMNELTVWIRDVLYPRLENQQSQITLLENELAAANSPAARAVAGALLGHVCESIAAELLNLPIPTDIVGDAELTTLYSNALREKAAPSLGRARLAYTSCTTGAPDRQGARAVGQLLSRAPRAA